MTESVHSHDLVAVGEVFMDFVSSEAVNSLSEVESYVPSPGGSPARLCKHLAALGHPVSLVASVGLDFFGNRIREDLREHGVDASFVRAKPQAHTSLAFFAPKAGKPNQMEVMETSMVRQADYQIMDITWEELAQTKIFHTTAFALGRQPARASIWEGVSKARQRGALLSMDFNFSIEQWPNLDEARSVLKTFCFFRPIIKMNNEEFKNIWSGTSYTSAQVIDSLMEAGAEAVVFTDRIQGNRVYSQSEATQVFDPIPPVEVSNPRASGDAFWAGFLSAKLAGKSLSDCVECANQQALSLLQSSGATS
ncbi:PfkB family carbohydrate kinase [Pontibacter sp. G13]|uniref:carbohydrate kinase family protein n=1 Tax=Pontibacter sp. G13 TaxID=3074898 RepID=UPI0028890EA7|nr:PfkB family carbohydrate kinase [Pontibacter sp. G13]WNJ19459.1 PfkB family carbohydrate kinase [Pontibacter sp. G13]